MFVRVLYLKNPFTTVVAIKSTIRCNPKTRIAEIDMKSCCCRLKVGVIVAYNLNVSLVLWYILISIPHRKAGTWLKIVLRSINCFTSDEGLVRHA